MGRLLLAAAYIRVLGWPVSRSFSGQRSDRAVVGIVALTQFLGAMLSRHNYSRTATACAAGVSLATAAPVATRSIQNTGGAGGAAVRKGTSLVSLSVFLGVRLMPT